MAHTSGGFSGVAHTDLQWVSHKRIAQTLGLKAWWAMTKEAWYWLAGSS